MLENIVELDVLEAFEEFALLDRLWSLREVEEDLQIFWGEGKLVQPPHHSKSSMVEGGELTCVQSK
jgi:hypothetical protein